MARTKLGPLELTGKRTRVRKVQSPGGMGTLDVEQIDLAELLGLLRAHDTELAGELTGRSKMRDLVAAHLGCSLLEAEVLVDTLIARGFARLVRDEEGREGWRPSVGT